MLSFHGSWGCALTNGSCWLPSSASNSATQRQASAFLQDSFSSAALMLPKLVTNTWRLSNAKRIDYQHLVRHWPLCIAASGGWGWGWGDPEQILPWKISPQPDCFFPLSITAGFSAPANHIYCPSTAKVSLQVWSLVNHSFFLKKKDKKTQIPNSRYHRNSPEWVFTCLWNFLSWAYIFFHLFQHSYLSSSYRTTQ